MRSRGGGAFAGGDGQAGKRYQQGGYGKRAPPPPGSRDDRTAARADRSERYGGNRNRHGVPNGGIEFKGHR
jgi:hypothetical protein